MTVTTYENKEKGILHIIERGSLVFGTANKKIFFLYCLYGMSPQINNSFKNQDRILHGLEYLLIKSMVTE